MVAWSAARVISDNGAGFMPHEQVGAESAGTPQIALPRLFCAGRCIGHILALQQQHCEAAKNAEASMADGVANNVVRSTRARSLRIIGGIVTPFVLAVPS